MLITIPYPNGYVGVYEDGFKPGDVITAYKKGYHVFVDYKQRGVKEAPLVIYQRVFNFNGKPSKGKKTSCDAAYCRYATDFIEKKIVKLKEQISLLEKIPSKI
jgi:hypothetical protein